MIDSAHAYKVIYPRSAYTLPVDARARKLTFDTTYMHWDPDDGPINEDLLVASYLAGGAVTENE